MLQKIHQAHQGAITAELKVKIHIKISRPLALLRNAQLHLFCDGILFIVNSPSSAQGAPLRRHGRLRDTTKSRGGMVAFARDSHALA